MLEPKIIEEKTSSINGKIQVVRSLAFGKYIQVEGLTQSGGVVYEVWESTLKHVRKRKPKVKKVLILGLGGGSAAKLVRKYWKGSEIVGIDIDPVMIEMGEKHLGLKKIKVKTEIADACKYVSKSEKEKSGYFDLILVDTYLGDEYPKELESVTFIKSIRKLLNDDGVAVFNRLYWDEKRKLAHVFLKKLESVFETADPFYPEANVMFVCKKK